MSQIRIDSLSHSEQKRAETTFMGWSRTRFSPLKAKSAGKHETGSGVGVNPLDPLPLTLVLHALFTDQVWRRADTCDVLEEAEKATREGGMKDEMEEKGRGDKLKA